MYRDDGADVPVGHARHLAEELSGHEITTALYKYGTRRKPEGLFYSAWNHIEYSLNKSLELEGDIRECYLDYAQDLVGYMASNPDAHQGTQLSGLVLASYLPVFRKRMRSEEILRDDCNDIYQSLGAAIKYLEPLTPGDPPDWRMSETAILAASARITRPNFLLFPTSPREESSATSEFNHDSYFYAGDHKLPIQQKLYPTDKQYDDWITILTLQPMLARAYKKSGVPPHSSDADQLNYFMGLIVSETSGYELDRSEKLFLDHMSSHKDARNEAAAAGNE